MRYAEFQCKPSVEALIDALAGRQGRFVLEDVKAGRAIVGADPLSVLTSKGGVTVREQGGERQTLGGDPFEVLRAELACFARETSEPGPVFVGGAVGYLSYDLGRQVEHVPSLALEDVPTPDYCFGFYDSALCIDLASDTCQAVSWSSDAAALEHWRSLALSAPEAVPLEDETPVHCEHELMQGQSNFPREAYLSAVQRVKDYIAAGDVYQVNLSQRFRADLRVPPFDLYRSLRRINPAPKSCFLEIGPVGLASASPEVFLTYDPLTRRIVTKPIKGTRPRGCDANDDDRFARELAASEKDRAENLMIVDMERNDLGRVAEYGSVEVCQLWDIERHPNVFQMVSTVEARLRNDCDPIDLIKASFPGGSITGAPKVRAMEIIEELEPHRRGIYTGSAGFIDFRGSIDLNIVIRSFITYGGSAYYHAGGGIVIDSDPSSEYQETLDKVAGLDAALRACNP